MEEIENQLKAVIPFKWRVQSVNQYGATCVAYIDARDVMARLDEVVGISGWQDAYYELKNRIFCKIGIWFEEEWVWKSDCGSESNIEKEKGESSDAFKRAAVHWGIGRFLYEMKIVRLKSAQKGEKWYASLDGQNPIYGDDVTKACNDRNADEFKPVIKKPELLPNTDQWASAKGYLIQKGNSIEQVKKKYYISATNEADLIAETINDNS